MLREQIIPALSWSDKTMTVIKERQMEAWANRLMETPDANIFSKCTDVEAQALWEQSYEWDSGFHNNEMIDIQVMKTVVLAKLSREVHLLSFQEHTLIEQLLIEKGKLHLHDWEQAGAAESLVRRLWCNIAIEQEHIVLYLPSPLHEPLRQGMDTPQHKEYREKIFRFGATIHGLLYISGFMPLYEPMERFLADVVQQEDVLMEDLALRYFKASFDYVYTEKGELILVHPGLAEPDEIMYQTGKTGFEVVELSTEMMVGAMNELLPEEEMLHRQMVASLKGNVRPEYDPKNVAQDLRLLAKQGAPLEGMKEVLHTTFSGYPNKASFVAVEALWNQTPSWYGLGTMMKH
ncbi:MAG: hypothetical protein GX786_06340 [Clostridiales bacterium]|nr:hypothetical protein [Clostridiales bacterium]